MQISRLKCIGKICIALMSKDKVLCFPFLNKLHSEQFSNKHKKKQLIFIPLGCNLAAGCQKPSITTRDTWIRQVNKIQSTGPASCLRQELGWAGSLVAQRRYSRNSKVRHDRNWLFSLNRDPAYVPGKHLGGKNAGCKHWAEPRWASRAT